ncbi:diphosphomevalonate decarboxylase [Candidatus Binatia bacterium]|jgi:diphosphomevalonate decarboxylase|nr:diphosphomevalonate decarboxylase [Candidatus Binatia bacterium]
MPEAEKPFDADASSVAVAHANVALVKYWGKRDERLNLPAVGSISLTLAGLRATATVGRRLADGPRFVQDGRPVEGTAAANMAAFLDLLAGEGGPSLATMVEANFPVGAGLASSAAIYCAVTAAALSALGRRVSHEELSALARRGSGSAARSVYGGLVEWHRGEAADGSDSVAKQILPEDQWPLALMVAITSEGMKRHPSRDAMRHVAATSPLYPGWLAAQDDDLRAMRAAIAARDLPEIGRIAEENCLRMHATGFAARPPVVFWTPATMAAMDAVHALRDEGIGAWFTIDAGPQVKVLCRPDDADTVAARLRAVPGVLRVLRSGSGPGVAMQRGEAPWR